MATGEHSAVENSAAGVQLAQKLLDSSTKADVNRFPALGEGPDLRLQGNGLTDGALEVGERIIHMCAFRLAEPDQENGNRHSRMARASVRLSPTA